MTHQWVSFDASYFDIPPVTQLEQLEPNEVLLIFRKLQYSHREKSVQFEIIIKLSINHQTEGNYSTHLVESKVIYS